MKPQPAASAIRGRSRILVVGCSGSGKSSLARRLSAHLGLPCIHLDTYYWQAGWKRNPDWEARLERLLVQRRWVMDGNFIATLARRLDAGDGVIFLDLPRWQCYRGILLRYLRDRGRSRDDIPEGCVESLETEIIRWVWSFPKVDRPVVLEILATCPDDKPVIVLRSRREVNRWLAEIESLGPAPGESLAAGRSSTAEPGGRTLAVRRSLRRGLIALVILAAVATGAILLVGQGLTAPARADVGRPPADLTTAPLAVRSASGSLLKGWVVPADRGRAVVILMHGVGADRRSMVERARFLHRSGFVAILFDFQAHGESEGSRIGFGAIESSDAHAMVDHARRRYPGLPIFAIGCSMGGAAAVLGPQPLAVDAMVLEGVYPTIQAATHHRIAERLGSIGGAVLTPILMLQLRPILGISAGELAPIDRIKLVRCPVFVISGGLDRLTTVAETRELFDAAPEPKQLWLVEGAGHVDLHAAAREEYERRVIRFLEAHLL